MTFVWIAGWSAPPAIWRRELERWPDARHVLVDFDGCSAPADFPELARQAVASAEPPVRVVGWSLGAMVALELEGVAALYLVAASPRFGRERVLRRMRDRLATDPEGVLRDFVRQMLADPAQADAWLAEYPASWPVPALAAGLDYLAGFSLGDPPDAPAFLLHGGADAICPLAGGERLAELLPDAELTVWDERGHAPFWTEPERFHGWLRDRVEQ